MQQQQVKTKKVKQQQRRQKFKNLYLRSLLKIEGTLPGTFMKSKKNDKPQHNHSHLPILQTWGKSKEG